MWISKVLSDSVSQWQRHLLSCSGQLKKDLYFIQNITILLISSHKASLLEASGDSQTAENPSHILPPALLADKRNNNFLKLKCWNWFSPTLLLGSCANMWCQGISLSSAFSPRFGYMEVHWFNWCRSGREATWTNLFLDAQASLR